MRDGCGFFKEALEVVCRFRGQNDSSSASFSCFLLLFGVVGIVVVVGVVEVGVVAVVGVVVPHLRTKVHPAGVMCRANVSNIKRLRTKINLVGVT